MEHDAGEWTIYLQATGVGVVALGLGEGGLSFIDTLACHRFDPL